jgi:hypothetical protein
MKIAATELLPKGWERVSEPEGNKSHKRLSIETASVDIESEASSLVCNPETYCTLTTCPLYSIFEYCVKLNV